MKRILVIFSVIAMGASDLFAQNLDLLNNKDFQEMNKLNPSLTGVLNRFRFLGNQSTSTDLGFETRWFKSASHLGFNINLNSIDNLSRRSFNASYARDFNLSEHATFKLGANVDYQIKVFHQGDQILNNISFKDFNGFEYHVDSLNIKDFSVDSKFWDVDLGASLLFKNILVGVNVNHINRPDISIQRGVEQLADLELNAQLVGFFNLGLITVMPTGVYAVQQDDVFSSYGLSLNRKQLTLNAQYESYNDDYGYDFGVSYRYKKRHFINLSYRSNLATPLNQKDGIFSLTLNSTIFNPKKDLEGILDKIKNIY